MKINLKINGIVYENNYLLEFCKFKIKSPEFEEEKEIYEFILNWFDSNNFINVQTSGTTNTPKTITLLKQHMINSAINTVKFFDIKTNHNILMCLPARFISGKMMIVRAFVANCNLLIVRPSKNPFREIQQEIYFTAITPYQLINSIETIKKLKVKNIIIGGAEIPPSIEKKLYEVKKTNFYATFGMTETCSHVALRKIDKNNTIPIYKALPGINFSVDEKNCLIINAPQISNEKVITKDIAELIDDKSFIWKGRYDNVINSGGIKFCPEEIEKKISHLIKYPYFIGSLKDDNFGEKIVLFLENKYSDKEEIENLKKELKKILSKYETPKEIVCLKKFIYSENKKIQRKKTISNYLKNFH